MNRLQDERTERMFYYRQLGMPLALIGKKFGGLSKERVRMLLLQRERQAERFLDEQPEILDVDQLHEQYNWRTHAAKAAIYLQGLT